MVRAIQMGAVSTLCLVLASGCASLGVSSTDASSSATKPATTPSNATADASDSGSNLPVTLDGEIKRAQELRAKGDYDEAVRSLAQLMLFAPDDPRVVGEYGKVLEQEGHSQEALAYLKRAVELAPHEWSLHSALGVAYDQLDDHASAKLAYERALALKPGEGSVLNNYGVSRMLAGDYTNARKLFARAEAAGSPNPKIALNLDKLESLNAPAPAVTASAEPAIKANTSLAGSAGVALHPVAIQAAFKTTAPATKKGQNPALTATAAPKMLGPQVVMQRVPVDPLAGPVAHRTTVRTASVQKPKTQAAAPADTTPALRTAADAN